MRQAEILSGCSEWRLKPSLGVGSRGWLALAGGAGACHWTFEDGSGWDWGDALGSTLMKPKVVGLEGTPDAFWRVVLEEELLCVDDPERALLRGAPAPFFLTAAGLSSFPAFLLVATGRERPRSFPRLATPTPQVKVVLYPEQSLPRSRHCVQYGLLLSHGVCLSWHAKQSSAAPLVGALLRRLRMAVGCLDASEAGPLESRAPVAMAAAGSIVSNAR
jgi:hypothetical protein